MIDVARIVIDGIVGGTVGLLRMRSSHKFFLGPFFLFFPMVLLAFCVWPFSFFFSFAILHAQTVVFL
jgi:hypothetical protein